MSWTETLRKEAFWTLDRVSGSQVRQYYEESEKGYLNGVRKTDTERKLKELLFHAEKTVPYYASFAGITDLQRFPVMNKEIYRSRYEDFLSGPYRDAPGNTVHHTSGSTGTPFAVVRNKEKVSHARGAALFVESLAGYQLGDRQAFLRVWTRDYAAGRMTQFMQNVFPVDTSHMDAEHMQEICNLIRKKRISSIKGYSSSLELLADYIEENRIDTADCQVRSIIGISEHLSGRSRDLLKKQFGCEVNMDYSNEENGIMAAQIDGGEYYVDSTAWHFEFLKLDSDEEAQEGELSRIVVTDLYNYAFPLIRYDTGDTAMARREVGEKEGTYRIYLTELYGRRLDLIYDINGKVISPHYISANMHGTDWIRQWQFVQEDKDRFLLRISGKEGAQGNLPSEEQTAQVGNLLVKFREMTGGTVNVEYVDEIPVLASGKRKCILNKMCIR